MAVLRPLKRRHRELPRGPGRGVEVAEQPRGPVDGHAQGAVLAGALHRAGRLPRGCRRRSTSGCRPGREVRLRGAYFIKCERVVKDERRARWSSCAAPTTRPRAAARRPDGRKVKATIHWVSAAHAVRCRGPALRPPVHRARTRTTPRRAATGSRTLNPHSLEVLTGLQGRAGPGERRRRCTTLPVRAARLLLRRSGHVARPPGLQPDGFAAGHVGRTMLRAQGSRRQR